MDYLYAVSIKRSYNLFGAWLTTDVTLYKLSKNGEEWVPINCWSYDTILSCKLSLYLARRKARELMLEYNACRI